MDTFFHRFHRPDFSYNPSLSPKANFLALEQTGIWQSPQSRTRAYGKFTTALAGVNANVEATQSELARFFGGKFPEFDYDEMDLESREGADLEALVKAEFERLAGRRKWKVGSANERRARGEFEVVLGQWKRRKEEEKTRGGTRVETVGLAVAEQNTEHAASVPQPDADVDVGVPLSTSGPATAPASSGATTLLPILQRPNTTSTTNPASSISPPPSPPPYSPSEPTPLDRFFRQFHNFNFSPSAPSASEYDRLSDTLSWDDETYYSNLGGYYGSLRQEFNYQLYRPRNIRLIRQYARRSRRPTRLPQEGNPEPSLPGITEEAEEEEDGGSSGEDELEGYSNFHTRVGRVEGWKRLCIILGLPRANSEKEAETILADTWVNIFDFIHHMRTDTIQALTRFKSLKELADYSHDTGLIYPLNEARGNEILKHLLRKIGSRKWNSRGGGGGGGKKDGGKQGTGKVKTGGAGKST